MPVADNPARCREVADAIALELNATLAVTNESDASAIAPARFTATRSYVVDYDNAALKTLHVDVRDQDWELGEESRKASSGKDLYQIEIAVQKAVAVTDRAAIDLLKDLTAHIARHFCPDKILGAYGSVAANQVQVQTTGVQTYNPDKIKQGRYFGLVILVLQEFLNR